MSKVNISSVVVLNNPAPFFDPFKFEVTFECYESINDDLEFKLIYVGSAESDKYDQELDSVLVGPVLPEGRHMFVFEAGAPDPSKIPVAEAVGVTVVLLTCSFHNNEFIKIGYFILNEYVDPEMKENPPTEPKYDLLRRVIDIQHPRVTKVPIKWDRDAEDVAIDNNSCDGQNAQVKENGAAGHNSVVATNGVSLQNGAAAIASSSSS